jgi:outer membrane protein OmpA-like peptidoglycan-associated protein/flagellar hook assembly protein FlgD
MKRHSWEFLGIIAILAFGIASCQTTRQAKASAPLVPPAPSSIATEAQGFSPKAAAGRNGIDFALTLGNPEKVKAWKVEMKSEKGARKTFSGTGPSVPATLRWDGKDDSGNLAPEGSYTASLGVEYVDTFQGYQAESSGFLLDITPPSGKLAVTPADLVPAGNGFASPASITIDASSKLAKIDSWSLDILDPEGKVFQSFSDKWPQKTASWDGLSSGGVQASPLTNYKAVARVRDEFGNSGEINAVISVADVPSASGSTSIEARYGGFAPKGESAVKTMDFVASIGQRGAVKAWKISIVQTEQGVQKILSGDSTNLPGSFSWDGMKDGGALAPEGRYAASLKVDYGAAFKPVTVQSKAFVLDLTPPSGTIVSTPPSLTPDGKGGLSPMIFTIVASSDLAPLATWELSVFGLDGRAVVTAQGQYPKNSYSWDGKLPGGAALDPARSYKLAAKVTDKYGNAGIVRGTIGLAEMPSVTSSVSITPKAGGFSPNGDAAMDAMELAIAYGQPQAVKSWQVEILKASQVVKTYMGDSSELPPSISWDGKKPDGKLADEGSYVASLAIDYGTSFKAITVKSAPFVLDLSVPIGEIKLSQPLFSPIESSPSLTITVDASSNVARMESWSMKIYDPAGNLFKSFEGRWPSNKVVWDGKGVSGQMVESAEDYTVTATVRDEFGNSSDINSIIPVDILVEKTATGYRILSSRIFFKAFTADYVDVAADLASQNAARLDQLAAKLQKFPDYKIRVVGHAVMINWNDKAKGAAEQEKILLPLSKSRAEAVKQAMVERGFDRSTIVAEGVGAADQLVPDSDLANRWRNRRVAFYLDKP